MSRYLAALLITLPLWNVRPCLAQDYERAMSTPVARNLLASSDPKDQAWGAWMAGRLLMTDASPQIERVIKEGLSTEYLSRWTRVAIGLDALIEIGATPDVQLLAATRIEYPVQSLILLSRLGPAADRVLLSIMADSRGYEWFAAANLLKARKAPGFAALLLKDLELTAQVVVSQDGRLSQGDVLVGGGVGDKGGGVADGYPPWTDYEFRACESPNRSLLATGPINVCYEKSRGPMGMIPALSSHHRDGPAMDHRLKYFEREWSPLKLDAVEQASVAWKSEEATNAALADLVSTVGRKYATAIRRLREGGWLTEGEARALERPVIRTSIRDLRSPQ